MPPSRPAWDRLDRLAAAAAVVCVLGGCVAWPLAAAWDPALETTVRLLQQGVSPPESAHRYLAELLAWSRELGFGLAATPVWFLGAPGARRPRDPRLRVELGIALWLALVPIAAGWLAVVFLEHGAFPALGRAIEAHAATLLLARPAALLASWTAAAYLLALGWRLRRPPAEASGGAASD